MKRQQICRSHFFAPFSLLLVLLLLGGCLPPATPARPSTYTDPSLLAATQESLSVIVSAHSAEAASEAVKRSGGVVTSDLWLIDAVAATVTPQQLPALARQPHVISIVVNQGISTAGDIVPEGGWVTERRMLKGTYALGDVQNNPAVPLPDGGFVSLTDKGYVLITDANGSLLAQNQLSGGPFKNASLVVTNGTIYVAGEAKTIHALNSDGSLRWTFGGAREKFKGAVAFDPSGFVYASDEKARHLRLGPCHRRGALDVHAGRRWRGDLGARRGR